MSANDYMDLYLKLITLLDYGRREINTQISIFQWQYQYKDLAIEVNETALIWSKYISNITLFGGKN